MKFIVTITSSKLLGDSYTFTCHNWSEVLSGITQYCEFKKVRFPELLTVDSEMR